MQNNPTIVITGNLGFIFSHVTDYFLDKGWKVHGIDNHGVGSHPELIPYWLETGNYTHHEMDVSASTAADLAMSINPEYLVHAAAYSDVDRSIKDPAFVIYNNAVGNLNMFVAALGITNLRKMLYINTDEIYGECKRRKEEEEILFPKNPYSIGKATGALMRYGFDKTYPQLKDKTVESRYCNIFGPRQDNRKVISRIIDAIKTGDPLPVHNAGAGYREYLHVSNIPPVVEMLLTSTREGRTYNVTNNDGYTVLELVALIEKMTGKKVPLTIGDRPGMDLIYQMSSSRIRDEFGWKPTMLFEQGLQELLTQEGL